VWPGPHQVELSIDLMRYRREAPNGVMEGLMVYLMRWGKEQGYRSFSLGMAPLSGFERSPAAPLWNRLGSFLYAHGETFYNFQGLRAYKDKFHPCWEPRYLAYPGGLTLPRTLADVAALIAGGYRRILIEAKTSGTKARTRRPGSFTRDPSGRQGSTCFNAHCGRCDRRNRAAHRASLHRVR
jgi:phosphatidylglycerol lysyltransferase